MASSRESESLQTLEEIRKFSRSTVFTEEKFPGGMGSGQSLRNTQGQCCLAGQERESKGLLP